MFQVGDAPRPQPTYALTRLVVLRLLGLVYFVAFAVFLRQGLPLIGHDGLLPADQFVREVAARFGTGRAFLGLPSLFWLSCSDHALMAVGWAGAALSLLVLAGYADALVLLLLWALYMSVVHVGQLFWGYGWEIQLLETGFLAVFLASPLDPRPLAPTATPRQVVWLFRWLIFRIMLGAGLIKLRGDPCWKNLTCLDYHYQTQPIPNPLSPIFHFMPHWVHAGGVVFNHFVEVICPFLLFAGRRARHAAAALMGIFQVLLILSGNLSFLNYLTLIPILACFDDGVWSRIVPRAVVDRARPAQEARPTRLRNGVAWALVVGVGVLSVPPVLNLLSPNQRMNSGFDALDLVNTYGAFGSVGKERDELIVEGTTSPSPENATWQPYEFVCKPGDPMRRPCVVSPYQPRLDWQMWFAAMSTPDEEPWLLHLVWKLLHDDPGALSLIAHDPFSGAPPTYIRIRYAKYQFAPLGDRAWWKRDFKGLWLPPLSARDPRFAELIREEGWSDAPR